MVLKSAVDCKVYIWVSRLQISEAFCGSTGFSYGLVLYKEKAFNILKNHNEY